MKKIISFFTIAVMMVLALSNDSVDAACNHAAYGDYYTYTSYMQAGSSGHYKIHHFKRICKKCKKVIKKDVQGNKTLVKHTFSGNKCTVCGYRKISTGSVGNPSSSVIPKVSYGFHTKGNYIFVNNPEAIRDNYLLDVGKEWLYSTSFSGRARVFVEQTAWNVEDINYGIQIYNPNNYEITVTFYKGAAAIDDWSYSNVWKTFENSDSGFSGVTGNPVRMSLSAYDSCWLFPDGNGGFAVRKTAGTLQETCSKNYKEVKISSIIEALLDLYASSDVYINFAAFKNFYDVNMDQVKSYSGNKNLFPSVDQKVYSGIGYKYPLASASLKWIVRDSDSGNLRVKLDDNKNSNYWETFNSHTALDNSQILSGSVYPLYVPIKYNNSVFNYLIAKNTTDPRSGLTYNWADYGVIYQQMVSITNKGTKGRTAVYRLSWDSSDKDKEKTIIYHDNDGVQKVIRTTKLKATQADIESVYIPAGKTVSFTVDVTLGGMSNGTVAHSVVLK